MFNYICIDLFIKIINFINDDHDCKLNLYVSLIMTLICLDPCQWSLMSLITGNKVKIHTSQGEKEKDKPDKRILRSLSFDNNGLVKPSCGTVALYGHFGFF